MTLLKTPRCRPGVSGFSLIELLVALAIVALLTALAVSAYSAYASRARLAEVLVWASSYRTLVLENASAGKDLNEGLAPGGGNKLDVNSDSILRLRIVPETGAIAIDTTPKAGGGTMYLIPYLGTGGSRTSLVKGVSPPLAVSWQCLAEGWFSVGTDHYHGTLRPGVAPAVCRPT